MNRQHRHTHHRDIGGRKTQADVRGHKRRAHASLPAFQFADGRLDSRLLPKKPSSDDSIQRHFTAIHPQATTSAVHGNLKIRFI